MVELPRVLAIEDDEDIRYVITETLADEGYEVRAVGDGHAALAILAGWRPDVILLDLLLPDLDARAFRAAQGAGGLGADVPLVVVSASRDAADLAAELGAVAALAKPFDVEDLLATVARAADGRRQ